jgi:hypothetical protein
MTAFNGQTTQNQTNFSMMSLSLLFNLDKSSSGNGGGDPGDAATQHLPESDSANIHPFQTLCVKNW